MPNQTEGHYRPHTAELLRQFDAIARVGKTLITSKTPAVQAAIDKIQREESSPGGGAASSLDK